MPRYRVTLTCAGLTSNEGNLAIPALIEEFAHRPWHENMACNWDGRLVWLTAENDFDATGQALLDEFGDALIAGVNIAGTISLKIHSAAPLSDSPQ